MSDVFTHRGDELTAICERSVAICAGVDPGASRMVKKLSTHDFNLSVWFQIFSLIMGSTRVCM